MKAILLSEIPPPTPAEELEHLRKVAQAAWEVTDLFYRLGMPASTTPLPHPLSLAIMQLYEVLQHRAP